MLPELVTILCGVFILYLFWSDLKRSDSPSAALWVPLAWMFLAGSRWASSWLNLSVPLASVDDYAEGSPVDRAVFFSLIAVGAFILSRRKLDWSRLVVQNKWIVLYLLYCLSSVTWSDEPFVLFKRWIKDLGNPIMALIILTERRPYEAAGVILRRLAFLLLPLSVLFIKFYPDLGRAYHVDGSPMFTGVGHQKNDLGLMCLITGIYFVWEIFQKGKGYSNLAIRSYIEQFILIGMLIWLLYMSNSQTSFACLVAVVVLLFVCRFPFIVKKPSRIIFVIISSTLLFSGLESTLHLKDLVFSLLGRDPSLTNRTDVWQLLRGMETNSVVGAGFMSFWAGDRMESIWAKLGAGINQAHSGYLEQYLNLGYIGLAFIVIIMLSGLLKIRKHLDVDSPSAMLRLCFIVAAALYNYTEASFYGINNMWLLLLLGSIDISGQRATKRSTRVGIKTKAETHHSRRRP